MKDGTVQIGTVALSYYDSMRHALNGLRPLATLDQEALLVVRTKEFN